MTKSFCVAIAGLGTVGAATLDLLQRHQALIAARAGRSIQVVAVTALDKEKHRPKIKDGIKWVDSICDMATMPHVDAIALLVGGADGPVLELAQTALSAGKPVVTSNKALMATHGFTLAQLAEKNGTQLMFESSVGGGVPIVKTLRESVVADKVVSICGILNGTCNFILSRMTDADLTFDAALKEAQEKGYAEADPAMDVDGHDTAHKLALLSSLSFGIIPAPDGFLVQGIRALSPVDIRFAKESGYILKLLGTARMTQAGLEQWVSPCLVPKGQTLATTANVLNTIKIQTETTGPLFLSGPGAGGDPTASAVIADLVDLARGTSRPTFGQQTAFLSTARLTPLGTRHSKWFVRVQTTDAPQAMTTIAALFQQANIPLDSITSTNSADDKTASVIIQTQEANESAVQNVLAKSAPSAGAKEPPVLLKIEG